MGTCSDCHTSVHTATPKYCTDCHATDQSGNVIGHPFETSGNPCASCHTSGHNPAAAMAGGVHFNNITTGTYPPSYVTSRTDCPSCHVDGSTPNATVRHQWADSAHADTTSSTWKQYDFKTMNGCVQCHTTTGFIAYSTGRMTQAWGDPADKTKEVFSCTGCHSDITTGQLRTMSPVKPFADEQSYTNPDTGKSNLCMACHSGRNNGASIIAADFTDTAFIAPHYLAAGATLYAKAGYHFPGRTYSSDAMHKQIGNSGDGPCITCHKTASSGHIFTAQVTSVCATCHEGYLTAGKLTSDKGEFLNALEVLRAQLAANGFVYSPTYPYFSNTNWGAGQVGADTMGAAFNYVLLVKEPGAYAHDPQYAKQLVMDSIDYLDNGTFDDSIETAVDTLQANSAISDMVASSFTSYKNRNSCAACHGFTATSNNPITTNAHDVHLSGTSGLAAVFGDTLAACERCHSYNAATHINGSVNLAAGGCTTCHPGTAPAWTGAAPACTSCHASVPSIISGVSAPYKADFAAKGHGQYAGSNQCTACHNSAARHITGFTGDDTRLTLANDNTLCDSCHNDALKVTTPARRDMVTHFLTKGGGPAMRCDACHDAHGTSNLSMIKTMIAGKTVNYTDRSTGWVDLVTYRGLCQVCHTVTAYYRADGTGDSHFVKDCFNCHSHKNITGAFFPAGTCDGCHGYPPAPKNTSVAVTFGIENNWTGARFEDYSGGGGAHLVPAHVPKTALPSEGWNNCAICHNGGDVSSTPDHMMVTPVASNIANVTVKMDTKHRFDNSMTIYTSARRINVPGANKSGSCFNINCHMSPSLRWSMER